jgi:nucleotide-binding universal stress UspA family protein
MRKPKGTALADLHVVLDLGGERQSALLAAALARQFDAHLSGLALSFEPLIPVYPMAAPIPTEAIVAARNAARDEARAATSAFDAIAKRAGITFGSRVFTSIAGEGFVEMVEATRLSDLVIVAQTDPDRPEPMRREMIEAILFESGAPMLLVPYTGTSEFKTRRALLAWDGSVQAARAVRSAMPLLRTVDTIVVVIVEEAAKWSGGVPGADIADHLARHGLDVDVKRLDNPTGDIGATILNAVTEEEADWLVMGAYGHSRVREFLVGGVTRAILPSATVPVLMAH